MEDRGAARILDHQRAMVSDKASILTELDEIREYVMPLRDPLTHTRAPGNTVRGPRYDATACFALERLTSAVISHLLPAGETSFTITDPDDTLDRGEEAAWVEDTVEKMRKRTGQGMRGGYAAKLTEAVTDAIGYGTTALFTTEAAPNVLGGFGGAWHETWDPDQYNFTEGAGGAPERVFREFRLTPAQARERLEKLPGFTGFGEKLTKALASDKAEDTNRRFTFIQAIEPNKRKGKGASHAAARYSIRSTYVCEEDKKTVSEGGYQEMPVAIARWLRLSGDRGWGRGPGWTAKPHQKVINRLEELRLAGFAGDVAPPIIASHRGVIGRIRTGPREINYIKDNARLENWSTGVRWDVSGLMPEEQRKIIERIFLVDQMTLPDAALSSAAESYLRAEIMGQLLSPILIKFIPELFAHSLTRLLAILIRSRATAPLTPRMQQTADRRGGRIELFVTYNGPLTRAQHSPQVAAILRGYEAGAQIANARGGDARALDNLDDDKAIRFIAEKSGAPAGIVRDEKIVAQIRQNRAEEQQRLARRQEAEQLAGTARQAAEAISKTGQTP